MGRKISDELNAFVNELKVEPIADENIIKQIRKYKLITPLFGGGAETKKADAVKIIRETEIRGQLRFWWRAIRGVGTIKEMSKREAEIFGTSASEKDGKTFGESKVKVFVTIDNEGKPSNPFLMNDRGFPRATKEWEKIAYIAFPLQPTSDEIKKKQHLPMKEIVSDIEFTLEISFPKNERKNVEASLWAWETLGGVGGRTRRGFGSIELQTITENEENKSFEIKDENETIIRREKPLSSGLTDFKKFFNDNILEFTKDLVGKSFDKDVPHISENSDLQTQTRTNPQEAWEFLIKKLQDFRQARPMNEIRGRIDYGRSYWSEPDAIRHHYLEENPDKENSLLHLPEKAIDNVENVDKFPRAAFGLPIVFHFPVKKADRDNGWIEPPDTELKSIKHERLSSPLILKTVACEDGKYIALAFVLETPKLSFDEIHLFVPKKPRPIDIGKVETDLNDNDAKNLTKNGLTLLNNEKDVLKAFLKTI